MDRTELELSDSPAAPANDTSVWSIGNFLAWTALSSPTSVTWASISISSCLEAAKPAVVGGRALCPASAVILGPSGGHSKM